jgi:chromosome segregation ATPase
MACKLEDAEGQLKEAMVLSEKRAEDNYALKVKIDQQRAEIEKARKRIEVLEDQIIHREAELKSARDDLEKMHKKNKLNL